MTKKTYTPQEAAEKIARMINNQDEFQNKGRQIVAIRDALPDQLIDIFNELANFLNKEKIDIPDELGEKMIAVSTEITEMNRLAMELMESKRAEEE